ncbi:hypothetical protein N7509_000003 [Penicillium cosmopolitanum]|uniref:Transglycosylase SLT domain-containing protein n=1 Tax=Penicillium cosmopolitanum TaxID=1131564 RepID=A0A9X0B949_9EURO|nr:uncharacterized protein N7509_006532 [Penicillium cosmopolitanum]XP_056494751.1 uncharacterized protein N7509_000003 [Penicillium cosmopolitanum]KAJ5394745.1 hypothetical protein N7509_006532 [Penicillium cosmopolitanum]KAJ5414905.1 hypothetical protein N7509_000003 [Penicillium cosmopolitanum]
MILDGVEGTPAGPGLKALIAQEGGSTDVASFYKAARAYNSGTVASSGNLGQGIATHCYASDIANRLLGWTNGPSRSKLASFTVYFSFCHHNFCADLSQHGPMCL